MKSSYNSASMLADDDVMAELADGTGGTYFHSNNDLLAGFRKLALPPEYLYILEFTPTLEAIKNESFHRLKVKLDKDGFQVQTRHGYFVPKADKKNNAKENE